MSIRDFFGQPPKTQTQVELPANFDSQFLLPMRLGSCFLTSNKSILRPDGEFVYVHTNDFLENILAGKNCFLCGCFPSGVTFNDEHIIPNWLLRYTEISNMSITLPNRQDVRYSSYKVRSCVECNSFLSQEVEGKISYNIKLGYHSFKDFLQKDLKLVFQWLCLIFYKVHFKDFSLRLNVDRREHDLPIGAVYTWPHFHHIFCVARSLRFRAFLSPDVIGTIRVFRLNDWERHGSFDYKDHWATDTMFLRIKEICIYVSFTDANAVGHMMQKKFTRVPDTINYIQSIELFGDFVSAKLHFKQQHNFHSEYDADQDYLRIIADIANDFGWNKLDPDVRGSAQTFAFRPEFGKFKITGLNHEATFDEIASGKVSFFPKDKFVGLSFFESDPPDDHRYAQNLSEKIIEKENVRSAFKRLTKGFSEDD